MIGGKGTAAYEDYLRTKYGASTVEFLGFVDPDSFLRDVDVLVVPSVWHDTSPRVISEAYAHGVPVIGSRRGGIPELIEEDRTGFLFDSDLPDDLTLKMRRFVENPTIIDSMRLACLDKAKSLLPENIIEQYLEVYAGLMERP